MSHVRAFSSTGGFGFRGTLFSFALFVLLHRISDTDIEEFAQSGVLFLGGGEKPCVTFRMDRRAYTGTDTFFRFTHSITGTHRAW